MNYNRKCELNYLHELFRLSFYISFIADWLYQSFAMICDLQSTLYRVRQNEIQIFKILLHGEHLIVKKV